jgi:diguanylate cyclase (GGDEF)-like protein
LREANAKLKEQVASLGRANLRLSREVDARREADKQIRHMAFHDALTNLPNRLLLSDRIEDCIERCKTRPNYRFALLYCDIDNFKLVNDSLGHLIGDQLLLQVSARLSHTMRTRENSTRDSLDMVARLSGDEFVILVDEVQDDAMVALIGERVKDAVNQSITIEQNELHPTISIGVAVSEGEYIDPNDMLRDADTALYHAKDLGKGRVSVFDQPMRAKVTERMAIESELRRAIVHKQFVVYYQPIHSLTTGKPTSVEALVRWLHPESGLRSPDSFIPIAEESGMIEAIGKLVLAEAVDQVAAWRRDIPGAEDLSVSVNLSPRQLVNRNILSYIDEYLERNNLDPSALKLEITENAMMRDLPMVHGIVEELAKRGVEIYLDDFGTGYSSLSILHTLPFSTIKIDRSFVSNMGIDLESPITIQAITMLAQTKGMKVVAEGVETIEQLSLLQELNCEFGQGYYFSRPLPPMDMEKYIAEQIGDENKIKEFSAAREASQDSWRI